MSETFIGLTKNKGANMFTKRFLKVAVVAPLAALSVLVLCGVCSVHILHAFGDTLMYSAMAVFMLVCPAHRHTRRALMVTSE